MEILNIKSAAIDEGSFELELSAEDAAAIAGIHEMLRRPIRPLLGQQSLQDRLLATDAPVRINFDPLRGRHLLATRPIKEGEIILREDATAWNLSRSPGSDGLFALAGVNGQLLTTLPQWHTLRLLRDTLTFSPVFADNPESGYAYITQLLTNDSVDGNFGPAATTVPLTPPGIVTSIENEVPCRVQLLAAIAQSNAFVAAFPEEDSDWKRGLLWPLLGRVANPDDRDILFDDVSPLSSVTAYFVLGGLLNHSCRPNVRYTDCAWTPGDLAPHIIFRAAQDIAAGEEVCGAYLDPGCPHEERRRKLLLTYGFVCRCPACIEEVGPDDELSSANHFPSGNAARGRAAFYASGGTYPA
jgi:hypothetical protein